MQKGTHLCKILKPRKYYITFMNIQTFKKVQNTYGNNKKWIHDSDNYLWKSRGKNYTYIVKVF